VAGVQIGIDTTSRRIVPYLVNFLERRMANLTIETTRPVSCQPVAAVRIPLQSLNASEEQNLTIHIVWLMYTVVVNYAPETSQA
jgi:hypothetical protein